MNVTICATITINIYFFLEASLLKPKSKAPFLILAIFAVLLMVVFAVLLVEEMWLLAIFTVGLFIATFGVGFTLKKRYRENDWL